jgi:hypothetical protein
VVCVIRATMAPFLEMVRQAGTPRGSTPPCVFFTSYTHDHGENRRSPPGDKPTSWSSPLVRFVCPDACSGAAASQTGL